MQKIQNLADLDAAIRHLEIEQAAAWVLLREEITTTSERLKLSNILKSSLREMTTSVNFRDNLLGTVTGLTAGFLTKALVVGVSANPIKRLFGTLLEFGISNLVSRNPEKIKSIANGISTFFRNTKSAEQDKIR